MMISYEQTNRFDYDSLNLLVIIVYKTVGLINNFIDLR